MAAEWVKWLLMLVFVGLVTSFPSFPNPYDESEYEKLVEMMEVMAARPHNSIPSSLGRGNFGDGDLMQFAEKYVDKDYPTYMRGRQPPVQNDVAYESMMPAEQGDLVLDEDWQQEEKLSNELIFGQVGGLATCKQGNVHIFHRGERTWEQESFFENETYAEKQQGPIQEPAILRADRDTGKITLKWGANFFYLPHGLTIDHEGYFWMTDVAMHQVFKFRENGTEPVMTLGKAFQPAQNNHDEERFCKPTDVAVASNGDIYVSDGYCNSRVVRFSSEGKYLGQFGDDDFYTPHSLALAEELDMICVADRDNKRIACYNAGIKEPAHFGHWLRDYGGSKNDKKTYLGRVFAIEYSSKDANNGEGQFLYGVTGPEPIDSDVKAKPTGFTIDLGDDIRYPYDIIARWSPWDQGFHEPHDLAVTRDGNTVYVGELDDNSVWQFDKPEEEM